MRSHLNAKKHLARMRALEWSWKRWSIGLHSLNMLIPYLLEDSSKSGGLGGCEHPKLPVD
ncbi:hypothetical protein NC652_022446 [Populus alba x Populus x berolinensis]|nr:hypothetical protein NC652_022446 [Populus alba x Populus x berolinensis]